MPPLPHNLEYVPEIYTEYEDLTQEPFNGKPLDTNVTTNLTKDVIADDILELSRCCDDRPSSPLPPIGLSLSSASSISAPSSNHSNNLFFKDTKKILNERINNDDNNNTKPPPKVTSFQSALDTLIDVFTRNCLTLNNHEERYYPDPTSVEINFNDSFGDAETLSSISTPSKVGGTVEEYYLPWVEM